MIFLPWVVTLLAAVAAALAVVIVIEQGAQRLARHREAATARARMSLLELFVFLDPQLLYVVAALFSVAVVFGVLFATRSLVIAIGCGVSAALLPAVAILVLRRRRRATLQRQFPDALLMLAGALRAGSSLSTSIQQIGAELPVPTSQEFAIVLREQRLGVSLDAALENLATRINLPSVALAVSAMRIAYDSGGGLAEALERSAATLRNQLAIESKIRALTSQGKLQAVIVGLLPVVLLLILMRMEPTEMSQLFVTRAGIATLALMGVFEFLGVYVIRRIVSIDV